MKILVWFLLIIAMFTTADSDQQQNEINCLRSIKELLEDPMNSLSTWQFDSNDSVCEFHGIECWHPDEIKFLSINVSGMGLRGEFPSGIANCSSLVNLDLSRNDLNGSIPTDISDIIPYMTYIDLSFNRFSGEIPPDFANCSFVNVLKLNNNLLTGEIPEMIGLLPRLRTFSVANNYLSGSIPIFSSSSFLPESFENNEGLCGQPLDPCRSSHLKKHFVNGFFQGWAAFFVLFFLGGVFLPLEKYFGKKFEKIESMAISILEFFCSWKRMDHNPNSKLNKKSKERKGMTAPRLELLPSRNTTGHNNRVSMLDKLAAPSMSFLEFSEATDGFSEKYVIASGETATIYKAVIRNGWCLSVKRLYPSLRSEHEFFVEVSILGRIWHTNLLKLIGFCVDERLLIFEFMPNGSLYDRLFSTHGKSVVLEWPVKIKIAVGVAKGIAWLHQNGVVHRGITTKCILLDQDFDPKISEFGRATPVSIHHHSTYSSYVAEQSSFNGEYSGVAQGSYVEDVYGFGVLLVELITEKKHRDLMNSFGITNGDLVDVVSHLLDSPEELRLDHGETASRFLRIAGKCVGCELDKWPSMVEVYRMLIGTRSLVDDSDTILKIN